VKAAVPPTRLKKNARTNTPSSPPLGAGAWQESVVPRCFPGHL
jgi:hypothetical protein